MFHHYCELSSHTHANDFLLLFRRHAEIFSGEDNTAQQELIDINQHLLNVMGVGHPALDMVCRVTLAKGLHSKLTGAGGGGCGITLLRPETDSAIIQSTMQDLKDCGFDCWETSIGGPGVQQHSPFSIKEEILEILNRYGVPRVTEQEDGLTL
uniref:Mevalonate kinase n=1 Tax=Nothobranchius furzeri TaxID=105023 RepID=A0A8C6Q6L9_NOTFU